MSSSKDSYLKLLNSIYQRRPDIYAEQILKQSWTHQQKMIVSALLKHKRVLVKAAHSIGKTHLAAGLVNWFFDCFHPSITITTAPTQQQVIDVLWKEIRTQRGDRPYLYPRAPRMQKSDNHYAVGYTASSDVAFQGRHAQNFFIIFDECVGIPGEYWDAAEGMLTSDNCYFLAICNPTDTTSRAYQEDLKESFYSISFSVLDHPNVTNPDGKQYGSLSRRWVQERLNEWCDIISQEDFTPTDIEFNGRFYRPRPIAETRLLGRWASQETNSVWSDKAWMMTQIEPSQRRKIDIDDRLVIGCDAARYGDDFTSILVRRGTTALHHETHNGWSTAQTAGRLKQLAQQYAKPNEDPRKIEIVIDDDGVGGGIVDQREEYNFIGSSSAMRAFQPSHYPNRRSEIWFTVAEMALDGLVDLSHLSDYSKQLIRKQALAPQYSLDSRGRRVVEQKSITKKRIGRSPDDMDALNLAYAPVRGKVEYGLPIYI